MEWFSYPLEDCRHLESLKVFKKIKDQAVPILANMKLAFVISQTSNFGYAFSWSLY